MKEFLFVGSLAVLAQGQAGAAGYYLPNQDALATAKGNAFVATADSAAAVFYNPAGLTQLEEAQFQAGFYSIVLGNEAKMGGNRYEADTELQAAPHLYFAKPLNDQVSYGFGLNSPFGLGTDWGQDTPFRTVVTEARLLNLSGTAALAYKVNDELSVGVSLSGNYSDLTLEQGLGFLPNDYLRFNGDGFSASGGVGLRWQPHEQHAFGLNYVSKSSYHLRGRTYSNLVADSGASIDFMTPARAAAGYSYRPAPGWNIEANVEWIDWDSLNTLNLKTRSLGGSEVPVPFEWESSFIYEIGVSYVTPGGYVFAAGYDYNESAQPDANFTPGVSDADRHWFNLGFGHRGECSDWMLSYQFGYSNRDVSGAVNPLANGKYEARHHALVFSWQRSF